MKGDNMNFNAFVFEEFNSESCRFFSRSITIKTEKKFMSKSFEDLYLFFGKSSPTETKRIFI